VAFSDVRAAAAGINRAVCALDNEFSGRERRRSRQWTSDIDTAKFRKTQRRRRADIACADD